MPKAARRRWEQEGSRSSRHEGCFIAEQEPLERQIERLRDQAEELLLLATARAEAGHGPITEKLTEVAAELETKARRLNGGVSDPAETEPRVQEFRLRTEELHAIPPRSPTEMPRKVCAAQSCERIAASLEKSRRPRR